MDKEYIFEISVKWVQLYTTSSKFEALELLKDSFAEEFNFVPTDKEIKILSVEKVENEKK